MTRSVDLREGSLILPILLILSHAGPLRLSYHGQAIIPSLNHMRAS